MRVAVHTRQEAVEALVKDLQEHNTTTYPLVENRGRLKGFRNHFSEVATLLHSHSGRVIGVLNSVDFCMQVWGQLVRACREGNGHDLHVLRSVIDVSRRL